jgi:hypothetical protein
MDVKKIETFGVCRRCWRATTSVISETTGHHPELFEKQKATTDLSLVLQ